MKCKRCSLPNIQPYCRQCLQKRADHMSLSDTPSFSFNCHPFRLYSPLEWTLMFWTTVMRWKNILLYCPCTDVNQRWTIHSVAVYWQMRKSLVTCSNVWTLPFLTTVLSITPQGRSLSHGVLASNLWTDRGADGMVRKGSWSACCVSFITLDFTSSPQQPPLQHSSIVP